MTFVVGITGGIGSGKTTVANLFAKKGIDIVDADIIAREVVAPGSEGLRAIIAKFGNEILSADGTLNRAVLREKIFSNPDDKLWLNSLLHPMIREQMIAQTQQATSTYCLLVIPLLVENKLNALCQRVLVVDVSEETQIARTTRRDDVSEQQVRNILASQATRAQRLSVADDVILNEGDSAALNKDVELLHRRYLAMATQSFESDNEQ